MTMIDPSEDGPQFSNSTPGEDSQPLANDEGKYVTPEGDPMTYSPSEVAELVRRFIEALASEKGVSVETAHQAYRYWNAWRESDAKNVEALRAALRLNVVDINQRTTDGGTPLMFAAQRGSVDSVCLLVRAGAHVNDRDDDERSALTAAAAWGHESIVRFLIENGADLAEFEAVKGEENEFVSRLRERGHVGVLKLIRDALAR
jgi:hypothetical protein